MVTWGEPPPSARQNAEYRIVSEAVHQRPNRFARVVHVPTSEVTVYERSKIRVKWAQAMDRRCDLCRVKAVTSDGFYSIYVIHKEEE